MSCKEWKEYKLDEVYTVSNGLSKKREEFGFGYEFLSFTEVFNNYFVPKKLNNLVNSSDKEREKCSIKRGDVFLTRTSEKLDELGRSCVALKDYPNATFNGFTKRLRPKGNVEILPEYAGYYFRSNKFKDAVTSMSSMTTRASLNNDMISMLDITVPPIEEQERIANILSSLDSKIELNNEINKTLEDIAKSIFKRWFVDFEFPNEDGEPYKSSGGEMVESELGMIPKGWEVKELGNCVTFSQGIQVPVKKQTEFYEEGLKRFLRIIDYTSNDNEEPRYVEDKGSRYYCTKREVAMVRYGNSSGFICRRLEGILANNLFKINPCYPLGYNYIYYLLSMDSIQEYITSSAIGSAMPALNHSIIANIKFVAPNEEIINKFEDISNEIEEKICNNRENSKIISSLRDALLPKLMSGEIK